MTVVSNMSPLHYLILIGCDRILPLLYGQVFPSQEPDQSARGVLQAIDDVLAVLDAALAYQRADLGREILLLVRKVEHDYCRMPGASR
jgi:hypothetical protein